MTGDLLVRWTARLAVTCYVARLWCDFGYVQSHRSRLIARVWWTSGCLSFILHVVAAFHFEHAWSHTAAFEATAKRTAEMTGWNSGMGLYINEAFLCLWIADTLLWWRDISWPDHRRIYWTVQGIFAFLMVQATAIFGPPFWKPLALLAVFAVVMVRFLRATSIPGQAA